MTKRSWICLLLCLLCGLLINPTSMQAVPSNATQSTIIRGPAQPSYRMTVSYDDQTHRLDGFMTVSFKQNLPHDLTELAFNLWPNAEPYRKSGGRITIHHTTVDGLAVQPKMKQTAMLIDDLRLRPQTDHHVTMRFTVDVPQIEDRFGWTGTTVSLGNWFPILAVYDHEGWNVDPFIASGESFYSLASQFLVTLTTSKKQVVATTGTEIGTPISHQGRVTRTYHAKQVRDFAMELDPTYRKIIQQVGSTRVQTFYKPEHSTFADDMHQAAINSLHLFEQKIGPYPYPELDVISMRGQFGGMEYPQLVMISIKKKSKAARIRTIVAHEVAHQWFYGQIGNNQYDDPWLDESFASFYESMYDENLDDLHAEPLRDPRYHLSSPVSLFFNETQQLDDFYFHMIYDYGARTLRDLQLQLGEKTFEKAMKIYFKQQQFGVTTTTDFINTMEKTSKQNLTPFFDQHRVFIE